MNWEIVGATGEWIGALAVIATLFYLTTQIRHQTTSINVSLQEGVLEGFNQAHLIFAESEELSGIFTMGLYHPDELSDNQAVQFQFMFRLYINQFLKIYRLHEQGLLSAEDWEGHASFSSFLVNTPGGTLFRNSHGDAWKDFYDAIGEPNSNINSGTFALGRKLG
jgi:hypothetical protein